MNINALALSPGSLQVVLGPYLPDRRDRDGVSRRFGVMRDGRLFVSPKNLRDLNSDIETVGAEDWDLVTIAETAPMFLAPSSLKAAP